jgi:peroxiredoxin
VTRAARVLLVALAFPAATILPVTVGMVAPDFSMTTIEGRRFDLEETERTHTGTVVLFVSTICPYSNYFDDLVRDMSEEFGKKNVAFVGINSGHVESVEEVRDHARSHHHAFDIIKDPESKVADLLDARRTPEAFLFDAGGTLRYHGRIASKLSAPDLKTAIESLLAGKPIHPSETKAFGCAILH